jgi:hypothetical protein
MIIGSRHHYAEKALYPNDFNLNEVEYKEVKRKIQSEFLVAAEKDPAIIGKKTIIHAESTIRIGTFYEDIYKEPTNFLAFLHRLLNIAYDVGQEYPQSVFSENLEVIHFNLYLYVQATMLDDRDLLWQYAQDKSNEIFRFLKDTNNVLGLDFKHPKARIHLAIITYNQSSTTPVPYLEF